MTRERRGRLGLAPATDRARSAAIVVFVTVVFVGLALRLWLFVDRFAVTLVYWDQWDFLDPLFEGKSWIDQFRWQHGPHRQGLAGLVYAVLYPATGWSSRAEAFVAWGAIAAAAAIAVRITSLVRPRPGAGDVFVPLAFFSYSTYELFFGAQNLANGPLPLLLVFASTWIAHGAVSWRRSLGLAIATSIALFTGFGLVLAPLVALLFLLEAAVPRAARAQRRISAAALALLLAAGAGFAQGYRWLPASECFESAPRWWVDYAVFLAAMSGRAWGTMHSGAARVVEARLALGLGLLLVAACVALWALWRVHSRHECGGEGETARQRVLFLLCGFSTLYTFMATSGRVCLGPSAALAPRYTIYAVPGMIGLFLWAATLDRRWRRVALAGLVALLLARELRSSGERASAQYLGDSRTRWVRCYLELHDVAACDSSISFSIYPEDRRATTRLDQKLQFLEANSLNLFVEVPRER